MAGYRSLHRQDLFNNNVNVNGDTTIPIWSLATSSHSKQRRFLWTAASTSAIKGWTIKRNSSGATDLTATALTVECVYELTFQKSDAKKTSSSSSILGCTVVDVIVLKGPEEKLLVASLDLAGTVRLWIVNIDDSSDDKLKNTESKSTNATTSNNCQVIPLLHEIRVDGATGTTLKLVSLPSLCPYVLVSLGCLDGSIALVSTGVLLQQNLKATPTTKTEQQFANPGTLFDTLGPRGSAVPLSLAWRETPTSLAVGRKDGSVDILSINTTAAQGSSSANFSHRLWPHPFPPRPVRALTFIGDGVDSMLIAGNDDGFLRVWDCRLTNNSQQQQPAPVLVHHVLQAHKEWILHICALSDGRRFVSNGTDQQIHVWQLNQCSSNGPLHTFNADQPVWACTVLEADANNPLPLLITASDRGYLQVFSLDKR